MATDLVVFIAWYDETDERKINCFEQNKLSIMKLNPRIEAFTIINNG